MAFKQELEDALGKIADPTYREEMRKMLERDPQFAAGWLRQNDYDREFNRLKAKEQEWMKWEQDWKKTLDTKTLEASEAATAAAAAQAKIADLEGKVSSGQYTPAQDAQMTADIKALRDGLENVQKSLGMKFIDKESYEKDIKERENNVVTWVANQFFDYDDVKTRHQAEFGKPFTAEERQKLLNYANERKIPSLAKAYEEMYSSDMRSQWEKNKEQEIRERVEKEIATKRGYPVSATPAPMEGPVQRMYRGEKKPDTPANLNEAVAAAAAALRSEGQF